MSLSNQDILQKAEIINQSIKANVKVLASLVNSRIGLTGLIDELEDDETKETLSQLVDDISKSIDELIDTTNSMFNNFNALVKEFKGGDNVSEEASKQE